HLCTEIEPPLEHRQGPFDHESRPPRSSPVVPSNKPRAPSSKVRAPSITTQGPLERSQGPLDPSRPPRGGHSHFWRVPRDLLEGTPQMIEGAPRSALGGGFGSRETREKS